MSNMQRSIINRLSVMSDRMDALLNDLCSKVPLRYFCWFLWRKMYRLCFPLFGMWKLTAWMLKLPEYIVWINNLTYLHEHCMLKLVLHWVRFINSRKLRLMCNDSIRGIRFLMQTVQFLLWFLLWTFSRRMPDLSCRIYYRWFWILHSRLPSTQLQNLRILNKNRLCVMLW